MRGMIKVMLKEMVQVIKGEQWDFLESECELLMRMILKLKTRAVECENDCNESFDASDKDARGSYVTYWAILSDFCVAMLVG